MSETPTFDGTSFVTMLDEVLLELETTRREHAFYKAAYEASEKDLAKLKDQKVAGNPLLTEKAFYLVLHSGPPGDEGREYVFGPQNMAVEWMYNKDDTGRQVLGSRSRFVATIDWKSGYPDAKHVSLWGDHGNLLLAVELDEPISRVRAAGRFTIDMTPMVRKAWPELVAMWNRMSGMAGD